MLQRHWPGRKRRRRLKRSQRERERERRRERESESESDREIKAAEGSGWERGNSQPFSDERNPTNPLNDKHVSVSPIPGLSAPLVCVCVCVCLRCSLLTDTLTPDTDSADDDTHTHTHTTPRPPFWQQQGKRIAWVLTDTSHHTLNTTLEPDSKALHLLFLFTPLFSFSPVLTHLKTCCSLTPSGCGQNNLNTSWNMCNITKSNLQSVIQRPF